MYPWRISGLHAEADAIDGIAKNSAGLHSSLLISGLLTAAALTITLLVLESF